MDLMDIIIINQILLLKMVNFSKDMIDYTILIYMIGSDLEDTSYEATKDIKEMLSANISPNINIVLQTGGSTGNIDKTRLIDFSINQRHHISNHNIKTFKNLDLGNLNMGESKTLSDFMKWGISQFPAKKYGIILWDHGKSLSGFGMDVNFDNDFLSLDELYNSFSSPDFYMSDGQKLEKLQFEFIGFDSCLMASIDVVDKLYSFAKYMIASQEIEPNWGWDYTSIIESLNSGNQTGASLGKIIMDSYVNMSKSIANVEKYGADRDITLSVIVLDKIQKLKQSLITLFNAFIYQENFDTLSAINFLKRIAI